jgi:hypothetical protein
VAINEALRQPPRETDDVYRAIGAKAEVINRPLCHELLYLVRYVHRCDQQICAIQVAANCD